MICFYRFLAAYQRNLGVDSFPDLRSCKESDSLPKIKIKQMLNLQLNDAISVYQTTLLESGEVRRRRAWFLCIRFRRNPLFECHFAPLFYFIHLPLQLDCHGGSAQCELRLFMSDLFITHPLHPCPHLSYLSSSSLLKHGYIKDIPFEPALGRLCGRQNLCDFFNNSGDAWSVESGLFSSYSG